jgi:hypothetical protein
MKRMETPLKDGARMIAEPIGALSADSMAQPIPAQRVRIDSHSIVRRKPESD